MQNAIEIYHLKARKYGQSGNCSRCSGHGYISAYRHVSNGICFDCKGSGDFRTPSIGINPSNIYRLLSRRWFIGFLNKGNGPEQIFAFTENDIETGKLRADREFSRKGFNFNALHDNFNLVIGEIDEDKKTLLARHLKKKEG